ncbi:hypothetical protein AcV5_006671 [Taiwanofungus camphoratus]|nr:hypothetical protein AcV5_006671 [Antrodia cinnamomea]
MAPLIMFPPPDLPLPGEVLLVTDELSSPADFLLHRSLSAHIKSGTHSKCVILAVAGDLTRWKAIAGKSNLNLADSLASGSLTYMELMPCAAGSDIRSGRDMPALKMLLNKLRTTLDEQRSQSHARVLIILDDIATLGWIGFSALALSRFARALCALCRRVGSQACVLMFTDEPRQTRLSS